MVPDQTKPIRPFRVVITELDGSRWEVIQLAASSMDAGIAVLDSLGRMVGIGAGPLRSAA